MHIFYSIALLCLACAMIMFIQWRCRRGNKPFSPYAFECGVQKHEKISLHHDFLHYAIYFLLFDIELIFIYPLLLDFDLQKHIFSLGAFIGILILGLWYEYEHFKHTHKHTRKQRNFKGKRLD